MSYLIIRAGEGGFVEDHGYSWMGMYVLFRFLGKKCE